MIAGLFWMAAAHSSALLGTHALWRKVRTEDRPLDALLFLVLHVLLQSAAVLAAGLCGALSARALGGAGLVVLAGLLLAGEHRRVRLPEKPDLGRGTSVLLGLLSLRMLLQVWFFAPHSGDALGYHLPKIGEWVQSGRFTQEMGLDLQAPLPAGFELLETWWVLFLRHDGFIEMAGVELALVGFAAVRLLALKMGLEGRSAFLAAVLYLATPLFALQATACYNDAPIAALTLTVAAGISARAHPLLVLVPLAVGLGVKGTMLYMLPGWLLLLYWRRGVPWLRPASLRWTIAVALLSLAIGGFWYARNLVWFGNPAFPVTPQGFEWGTARIQGGPRLASLPANVASLLSRAIYDDAGPLQPLAVGIAGWGLVAFGPGAVALVLGLREDRELRRHAAAFLVATAGVFLMTTPDDWCMRFVLFFPALLCIAAARLAAQAPPVALLVGAGVALQFATSCVPQELSPEDMARLLGQPWAQRSAGPIVGFEGVPPGEPVAVCATTRFPEYVAYGPDFSHRVLHLRVDDAAEMREQMVRHGVRYVYLELTSPRRNGEINIMRKIGDITRLKDHLYRLEQ